MCDQPTLALAGDESQSDSDDEDEPEDEESEYPPLNLTTVQLEKSLAEDLSSSNLEASHNYPSQSSFSTSTSEDETDITGQQTLKTGTGSKRSKTSYR